MFKVTPYILSLFCFVGCLQTENSNSADDSYGGGTPEFVAAKSVLRTNCTTSCHQHQFETQSEAELIAQGYIIAGDPSGSSLYYRIKGSTGGPGGASKDMPTDKEISNSDLTIIEDWILSIAP